MLLLYYCRLVLYSLSFPENILCNLHGGFILRAAVLNADGSHGVLLRINLPYGRFQLSNQRILEADKFGTKFYYKSFGLGDQHSKNHLPKPETVPFCLTQNMVDTFGPTGADRVYSCNLQAAMSILHDNRNTLLSMSKDPIINWKKHRGLSRSSLKKTH